MHKVDIRDVLAESNEDMLFLSEDFYDEALVGIVERCGMAPVALYDRNKCIELLIADGMTEDDALEYFDYNVIGSYMGENTPAFVTFKRDLF